jgi:hypothetical protein
MSLPEVHQVYEIRLIHERVCVGSAGLHRHENFSFVEHDLTDFGSNLRAIAESDPTRSIA